MNKRYEVARYDENDFVVRNARTEEPVTKPVNEVVAREIARTLNRPQLLLERVCSDQKFEWVG
jgi:hypothetical protein